MAEKGIKKEVVAVTGGISGFAGRAILDLLLKRGCKVRALTNSCDYEDPVMRQDIIDVFPLNFNFEGLIKALRGVSTLYITYWVRFGPYDQAVKNLFTLLAAAKQAKVRKIVYVSITNPSEKSPLGYFKGKAEVEQALIASGVSYAILRPAVLFGEKPNKSILINNIAWLLRNLPVFGVFGDGNYRIQPIHVDDLAELAISQGQKNESCIINAIGPETFTYRELVEMISEEVVGKKRLVISISPYLGFMAGWIVGKVMRDVIISRDEIKGLMQELLYVDSPPTGKIKLTEWIKGNADVLGIKYASEFARRRR